MDATVHLQSSNPQRICKVQNGGDDIISTLPNCVLNYIVSFLPSKDTVRTSILSTRWRHLWTSISNIDLDDFPWVYGKKKDDLMRRSFFLDFVDRVLILHDASDITRFRLRFHVPVNASRVNSWISAAVKHNVQELDLVLPPSASFVLPCCLCTCESLVVLKLEINCVLKFPTSICFPNLKSLQLVLVTFFDDVSTQRLFSSCPLLQELVLMNCGWENIKKISISIPTLRSLVFHNPFPLNDNLLACKIIIYAANIFSLCLISDLTVECLLYRLSSLARADINLSHEIAGEEVTRRAVKLLKCIQNSEKVIISGDILLSLPLAKNLCAHRTTFNGLTNLTLDSKLRGYNIILLMEFLRRTPNLYYLHIVQGLDRHISFDEELWAMGAVPCCFKTTLNCLGISISIGNEAEIHVLKFLLKNATVLKLIMIHFCSNIYDDAKKLEDLCYQIEMLPRGSRNCVLKFHW